MASVILVGIDKSDASRRAVEFARGRAEETGGTIVVAHVIPWSPYSFTTPEENENRHVRREAEIAAAREQILEPAARLLADVTCETVTRHGHPAEGLVALARERDATHIVVGRTGESRLRTVFFGSVPSQLIQLSDVPVTVVP